MPDLSAEDAHCRRPDPGSRNQQGAGYPSLEKLLRSAIANWEKKNEGERLEDNRLIVKEIFVNGGKMLKRVQPAPQGRAHRIRKRSNHVTIVVDKMEVKEAKK